ncbi:MAG: hypothetical protein AB7U82_27685 [Blastocatellales bacterium]
MASNIQSFPVELDLGNGTTQRLASQSCKVYDVAGAADIATVSTDASGIFPATATGLAVGSVVRIRIESYQGRAGYVEATTV